MNVSCAGMKCSLFLQSSFWYRRGYLVCVILLHCLGQIVVGLSRNNCVREFWVLVKVPTPSQTAISTFLCVKHSLRNGGVLIWN